VFHNTKIADKLIRKAIQLFHHCK